MQGRVMLNFETAQVQDEFERIKALGAAVIAAPYANGRAAGSQPWPIRMATTFSS